MDVGVEKRQLRIDVSWDAVDEIGVTPVNQFMVQLVPGGDGGTPNEIILNFGMIIPPVRLEVDSDGEVDSLGVVKVPVMSISRFVLSRPRIFELQYILNSLQEQLAAFEAASGELA